MRSLLSRLQQTTMLKETQDFSFRTSGQEQRSKSFYAGMLRCGRRPCMVFQRNSEPGVRRPSSLSIQLCDLGQVPSPLWVSVCSSGKRREEANQVSISEVSFSSDLEYFCPFNSLRKHCLNTLPRYLKGEISQNQRKEEFGKTKPTFVEGCK